MVLNQLRAPVTKLMQPIYAILVKFGIDPNYLTLMGLGFGIIAGWAFYAGQYWFALFGILLAGVFDMLDGGVARLRGYSTKEGAFLDSVTDRVAEIAMYTGLILGFTTQLDQLTGIFMLASAILVSYLRARGEGLGIQLAGIGLMERAERMGFLMLIAALGGLYGPLPILWGVRILMILTALTALHRFVKVYNALKDTNPIYA